MKQTTLLTLLLLMVGTAVHSQTKRIGDYIESISHNDGTAGTRRSQQYFPEGGAFVTTNGSNRYTRALYGGPTEYRIETSDRPVFAIFKKKEHRNVQLIVNGVPLDKTDYCVATYESGMRSYELRHAAWGSDAVLRLKVVACRDAEQALWRLLPTGFSGQVRLQVVVSNIRKPKLSRNGDIGVDARESFEADGKEPLQVLDTQFAEEQYVGSNGSVLSLLPAEEGEEAFLKAERAMKQLAGRVVFSTPDPYINTLGGALVVAADGDWDGETWLHGCVGWRMPLAGWRAGYLGDVLGWPERAVRHFNAYANSQVVNVSPDIPHPSQDSTMQLARAEKRWHTQMYSDGYICRNPNRNDQMHHYDMNLNYIDELLWHFQYDADRDYLRRMWPVLKRHLAWEKRNFDPDGDHLYDAYCCIWASDALYYSGGAVTHSSAYNYRANLLAARIAGLIGEDGAAYQQEADAILQAMNARLWLNDKGHWAEYQDLMGLKRVHESAAVWSVYTPIDCGACSPEQAYRATLYVDRSIPHIDGTIATSDWLPYSWSINNVAAAEVMHTALAFFEAGRTEAAYQLMKANIMDQMYYGQSPANFGQVSHYDAARGECYRDFGDCIGISARTLIQGLFGIQPDALSDRCILRPGFPASWDSASIHTPYMDYRFRRQGTQLVYEVTQRFRQPLKIVLRQNLGHGQYRDIEGTAETYQVIRVDEARPLPDVHLESVLSMAPTPEELGTVEPTFERKFRKQNIDKLFNAGVADIFSNEYRSPRPPYTTLQMPLQGIGEWCHPKYCPDINDSVFRSMIVKDEFLVMGVPFRTPAVGRNMVYTSLWDNYPDSIDVPLSGSAARAWLLMAGSTNHMQCRIDNGIVVARYKDGTADTLRLRNPDNWCPIEQDYYIDGKAFQAPQPRPYRVALATGTVSRDLGKALDIKGVYGREIPGGAAQMLCMPLDPRKKLLSLTVRTLSNDVVIGLMALTLQ
ncbi:MAG: DUF4450 domain-containing protein [Prevotella sp.]|nr:DUF4450 domain-containing protein [Prevotella sp.]